MATAKRFRWVCPVCGIGALGPKAPLTDATVRYCLSCSAKSPTLVKRTCPALDRDRAAAAESRKAKAACKREAAARQREAAKQREAKQAAERRLAIMNYQWPNDLDLDDERTLLREHKPAMVMTRSDGALYLMISGPHGTALRSAPHSRATMSVLLDYACEVGHPSAEEMQVEFARVVAWAESEAQGNA